MNHIDFKTAYEKNDSARLKPYRDYARGVFLQKYKEYNPDENEDSPYKSLYIYEDDIVEEVIEKMYENRDKYDPAGMAFSSFFYNRIIWTFNEYLRKYILLGGHARRIDIADLLNPDDDSKTALSENAGKSNEWEEEPKEDQMEEARSTAFTKQVLKIIFKTINDYKDPVHKRIIEASCGLNIAGVNATNRIDSGEVSGTRGYAQRLSEELRKEGIERSPAAIRTCLSQTLLPGLQRSLSKELGMSMGEIRENLRGFVGFMTQDMMLKDSVRRMLLELDADKLSDDDVAWLFVQFLK